MTDKTPISEKAISVTELNATIKACVEAPVFHGLEVYGEVSGARMSGPHLYFTLKDEQSVLKAVMFQSYASKLKFVPEDSMQVVVTGRVSVFPRDGVYQL